MTFVYIPAALLAGMAWGMFIGFKAGRARGIEQCNNIWMRSQPPR